MKKYTYKDAGVDVVKGEIFVDKIKAKVRDTYGPEVKSGVGGFCSLFDLGEDKLLAAGTDGVGTKLMLAHHLNKHDTIGLDLVAMCVNDILCCGARPLFFLDYIGCGELDLKVSEEIIDGIISGCKLSSMALVGGETAEMPGFYQNNEYDLAGFCVGEVHQSELISGQNMKVGDLIIGLSSTGFHANGFSLIRQLVELEEKKLMEDLLTPTGIYVRAVREVLKHHRSLVKGMAHITGGGMRNIPRMNRAMGYELTQIPLISTLPSFMQEIIKRSQLNYKDLYETFNMGIGFVLVIDPQGQGEILATLKEMGEPGYIIGEVTHNTQTLRVHQNHQKIDLKI